MQALDAERVLPVVLLLPGQGAQRQRMAAGLYGAEPVFTEAVDDALAAMGSLGHAALHDWLADLPQIPVDRAVRAQPLLFAVEYGLARLMIGAGVNPAALLGHSIGELAAATVAGVFTVPAAARLIRDRLDRLAGAPPGGMLAVAATAERLAPVLAEHARDGVSLGAVNAPRQTVLAGPLGPLRRVARRLSGENLTCRWVPADLAFHSPVLGCWLAGTERVIANLRPGRPSRQLYSGYLGGPLPTDTAADPAYWARHPVDPVLFWPALDRLLRAGDAVLVESGPGAGLTALAGRHPRVRAGTSAALALLPHEPGDPARDRHALAAALGRIRSLSGTGG